LGIIPDCKLALVPKSYDILGSKSKAVAIIELPEGLKEYESQVAIAIKRVHKNISGVLNKESERKGDFRIRELRLIAGTPNTEIVHRESGCRFKLDPRKVYFSPRESSERERMASKVDYGDSILVMFSGVGPYPIRMAKKDKSIRALAIELNLYAHNYCIENIHLNKVGEQVRAIQGDVREVCMELDEVYDRVLMPLPMGAHNFLDTAIPLVRENGVLHFYHWAKEPDLFTGAVKHLKRETENLGRISEILEMAKVSQFSPRVWKIRVDSRLSMG
jgi:tRNA (guanine37-N1)-methyltransferase